MVQNEETPRAITLQKTTPEEAAQNVQEAQKRDMSPDAYAEMKDVIKKEESEKPVQLSRSVAQVLNESEQTKKAFDEDLSTLDWLDKNLQFSLMALEGNQLNNELSNLMYRSASGEDLTPEEKFRVLQLNGELKELQSDKEDYGYTWLESLPHEAVVSAGYEVGKTVQEEYETILGTAAIGAGAGASMGAATFTPIGVGAGAVAGAKTGAGLGLSLAFFKRSYRQAKGQIYNDLVMVYGDQLEDMPDHEKKAIATGGGIASGLVGVLPIKKLMKNTPFFSKIMSPRAYTKHIMSPQGKGLRNAFIKLANTTAAAEGFEESVQTFTQIFSVNLAKTWDGTETSFIQAMEDSMNSETFIESAKAGAGGIVGGAALQGATKVATAPFNKMMGEPEIQETKTDVTQELEQVGTHAKGIRAFQLKFALDEHLKNSENVKAKKMLPEKMAEIRKGMFENAGMSQIYLDKDELNAWADSDEKAAKARALIGPDGIAASEINAPIRVETHKFLQIAEDHPEITNLVKADPTGPSFMEYQLTLKKAEERRQQILKDIPEGETEDGQPDVRLKVEQEISRLENEKKELGKVEGDNTQRIQDIDQTLDNLNQFKKDLEDTELGEQRLRDQDISNEEGFLEQQTFTKDMEEVLPAKEIQRLNEAEINARVEVADEIQADADTEVVIELNARVQSEIEQEAERAAVQYEGNVEVVESFLDNSKVIGELTPEQVRLKRRKLPIHAIDPELLDDRLRDRYLDDPVLKARKVFRKKNGQDPQQVAQLYGFESVEALLDVLAKTPTKKEIIDTDLAGLEEDLNLQPDSEIEESALAKAYDKISRLHLKTGEILRTKYWSRYKQGVKRVATDINQLSKRLSKRAKNVVGKTKVKNLKVNQWAVASRKSQRKAVTNFLDGKLEEGFREKQNAAYASQLAKETRLATKKVNRAFSYIAKVVTDPTLRAELDQAGKQYVDAVNYFTDVFNFTGKNQSDIEQYNKFAKKMAKRGEPDMTIPDEVMEWLTPQVSANELTVDQVQYIAKRINTIVHLARLNNRLHRKDEARTIEMIEESYHESSLKNPEYNEENIEAPVGLIPAGLTVSKEFTKSLESLVTNNQYIVQELDGGKLGGINAQLFHQPIVGTGHYEGPTGMVANAKLSGEYAKRFKKVVEKYYGSMKKFQQSSGIVIEIPEFKDIKAFRPHQSLMSKAWTMLTGKRPSPRFTKDQLLMMLANMGNAENRAYIANYGVDPEIVMNALEKHLTVADFNFVQEGMWNTFKTLAPRLNAVHKNTTGQDLDFVSSESFQAFGKTFEGGYFPVMIDRKVSFSLKKRVEDTLDAFDEEGVMKPAFFTSAREGLVRSPHTKKRTGSEHTISLDINRFSRALDEVIYDVTMREPIRDVMTLLNNSSIKKDIKAQIGARKYNTMVENVANLTNSISANNLQLHSDLQNFIGGVFGAIEGAFAVNYIAFNSSSLLMSSLVLPQVALKMGSKNFGKYMVQVGLKMGSSTAKLNLDLYRQSFELASEIDPSLQLYRQGIEDYRASALSKLLPKNRLFKNKPYDAVKRLQEGATDFAFTGVLGRLDSYMKTMTTVAVYNMYVNGDAPGHNYDSVHNGKTLEEIHLDAKAYAGQFLENTTMRASQYDKAALQKMSFGRSLTRFWNESRNVLNNFIQERRNVKRDTQKAIRLAKEGKYVEANIALEDVGGKVMNLFAVTMASKVIMNMAMYGLPFVTPDDEEEPWDKEFDMNEQMNAIPKFITYGLMNPFETTESHIGGVAPIYRDLMYSSNTARATTMPSRTVSIPLFSAFNDIAASRNLPGVVYSEIMDGYALSEVMEELTNQERRAFLNTVGYSVGGLPGLNQYLKIQQKIENEELEIPNLNFINQDFVENVDRVTGDMQDAEMDWEVKKKIFDGELTFDEAVKQGLIKMRNQVAPLPEGDVMTDEGYEIIKFAESNGRWNASPNTSGAFGIYQFTPGTWNRVMSTPEGRAAGLTKMGRLAKDPSQQEKAMRILTKLNVAAMRRKGVPINIESVYFAHHFGPSHADSVYAGKPDNAKLPKNLLTTAVLKANPQLIKQSVRTVGDMKRYIRRALNRGQKALTNN